MANPADKVTFGPKPILVGAAWALVATHALSGQQEHVIGFHSETEATEWLASKGCKAWLQTRGHILSPGPQGDDGQPKKSKILGDAMSIDKQGGKTAFVCDVCSARFEAEATNKQSGKVHEL